METQRGLNIGDQIVVPVFSDQHGPKVRYEIVALRFHAKEIEYGIRPANPNLINAFKSRRMKWVKRGEIIERIEHNA